MPVAMTVREIQQHLTEIYGVEDLFPRSLTAYWMK
jgi:hypothetical protein